MSETHPRTHLGAIGIALFVTVLWSSSWILIRRGLDDAGLEPITFAALRYGLAAALLVGWVVLHPPLRGHVVEIDRSGAVRVLALGVLFYAVTQGAQFVALDNQPATTTSLVLAMTPLLVAGVARRSLAEPPSTQQVSGTVLVVVGAWLYFLGDLSATMLGMTAALAALGAGAASAVLGRHINRQADLSPVVVTALSMTVGAGLLLVAGLMAEGFPSVSARAWLIIAWLAVVNTAWAFTLWNLSLRRLSAVESAGINNTMLVQIAVLAWIFLGETPGLPEVAGVVLVSAGVFLTQTTQLSSAKAPKGR